MISTSFADIFKQNSLKNSLLPIVVLAGRSRRTLRARSECDVSIDLAAQKLTLPSGRSVEFAVDEFPSTACSNGVDELGYIQQNEAAIAAFEAKREGSINTLA